MNKKYMLVCEILSLNEVLITPERARELKKLLQRKNVPAPGLIDRAHSTVGAVAGKMKPTARNKEKQWIDTLRG